AGKMQRAQLLLPEKIHAVVAPAAGDLDNELVVAWAVMRPVVGDDDFLDQIDRIAGMRGDFDKRGRGHGALLEATRRDGNKRSVGGIKLPPAPPRQVMQTGRKICARATLPNHCRCGKTRFSGSSSSAMRRPCHNSATRTWRGIASTSALFRRLLVRHR